VARLRSVSPLPTVSKAERPVGRRLSLLALELAMTNNAGLSLSTSAAIRVTAYAARVLKEHDDKCCQQQMTNTA
jgi:hypothetical protein